MSEVARRANVKMSSQSSHACPSNHITLHRSWRSVFPRILFAIGVAGAVFWFSWGTEFFGLLLNLSLFGQNMQFTLPYFLPVLGVLLVRAFILMWDCKHTIGMHHVYSVSGLCSLRKDNIEVPFEDILGVRSKQSILERILGVGTVVAWTASAEHPEIVMKGLRAPDRVVHVLRERIDSIHMR